MESNRKRHRGRPQPLWVPSSTYYFLASAVAIGAFFLTWAILNDAREESPWIPAGLIASVIMILAGVVREVVLRGYRSKVLLEQRRLDRSLLSVPVIRPPSNPDKLTLERNAVFLNEIKRKSDAAKVLSSIPASHREVFELCETYIGLVEAELPNVGVGSPRRGPLSKGREFAERFHRYHMLRWAEGQARSFAQISIAESDPGRKLEQAAEVLASLDTAAGHYPNERKLEESSRAVKELIISLKAKLLIPQAQNARLEGDVEELAALAVEIRSLIDLGEQLSAGANSIFEDLRDELAGIEGSSTNKPGSGEKYSE